MTEPSSDAILARLTALLETLQQQVRSMEHRLNAEFVTSRDLSNITTGVGDLRAALAAVAVEVREGLRSHRNDIREQLEDYITKDEFDPVKRIVYGLIALLLTSMVGALVALVFNSRGGTP